jgi:hypothetical protein
MPLFMDVHHHIPAGAGAQELAAAHQADLRVQDRYDTEYLRYWFDSQARTAFYRVEQG